MAIEIRQESSKTIGEYAEISTAFEVVDIFDVAPKSDGRFVLTKQRAPRRYIKDYDAYAGEGPLTWGARFDISRWAFFAAFDGDERVGGATVVYDTPRVEMLEGRRDLALLWDLRVDPAHRHRGVGTALFKAAATWAVAHGCRELKIETQNVNVSACLCYARQGCVLRTARPGAYADFPDEIQLLWYKDLDVVQERAPSPRPDHRG